jgi:predicted transcriptional regulator
MFASIIRTAIRSRLINDGPQTCSDLVRSMGLDPRRHKGTIHALMVDLEKAGVLSATRSDNGKRDLWFVNFDQIRKRDRLAAALAGI